MSSTNAPAPREVLLADVDAMFTAVARLVYPEVADADLLIVGGRDARGVVASASYGARAFGVRAGMPTSLAKKLCPDAVVVGVPRRQVAIRSRQIHDVLAGYAVVLEQASVDEFYLDVTGAPVALGIDLEMFARRIREHVLAETKMSLSIGGATNRLIAKMAASECKPAGVLVVPPGGEAEFMKKFGLADIPGVGPKSAERYAKFGLRTVPDALRFPREALVGWFGEREGRWLYDRIRGIDPTPVAPPGPAKSHSREETFPVDLYADSELDVELLALAVRVSADLRDDGRLARTVTVRIRDRDFRTRQASRTLDKPIETDREVYLVALDLLTRLRAERRTGVRLLGIGLSGLVDPGSGGPGVQLALFGAEEPPPTDPKRDRRLTRAVDALRERYGEGIVLPGALLKARERIDWNGLDG